MEQSKKQNIELMILVVAILGIAMVWFFFIRQPSLDTLVTVEGSMPIAISSPAAKEVLEAVTILRGLRLDTAIFEDPRFLKLGEAAEAVPFVTPRGRVNPFLPF